MQVTRKEVTVFFFLTWELDAQLAQIPGADADDARPIRGSPPT